MALNRNRYDPKVLLEQLAGQKPTLDVNKWCFIFKCVGGDIDNFNVYIPEGEKEQNEAQRDLVSLIGSIDQLDNLVQDSCEKEAKRSKYGIENYMLHIGWIDLTGKQVRVRYYGTRVNTERDFEFQRDQKSESWSAVPVSQRWRQMVNP